MVNRIPPPWLDDTVAHEPAPAQKTRPLGRWVKGQSGNPNGRPPGRPDARTKITRALLEDGFEIARVVTEAAKEGDLQACSLVLSRIAPALKPEATPVQFAFDASASISEQVARVLDAMAAGVVAPDVAKVIIESVKALADVRAVEDLEQRIVLLEAKDVRL